MIDRAAASSPGHEVLAAAEGILAGAVGGPVALKSSELLAHRRSSVYRLVLAGPMGTPRAVILKVVRADPDHVYDPDDPNPESRAAFLLNEWAGYAWLGSLPEVSTVAPRLLGADRTLGCLVIEDLGTGPSLADLLLGTDPGSAEQGLRAYAAALGRLHADTAGRFSDYARLRTGLGPSDGRALPSPSHLPAEFETLACLMRGVGVEISGAAREEVTAIAEDLHAAGDWFAYSPSDICPDNNRYLSPGRLRLFDFEGGGFRHALLDAAYLRIALPTCWCVNRLPSRLLPTLEAIYRAELSRGCPTARDDARFEEALVAACAAWLIWSVSWQWQRVPDTDRPLGPTTFRQSILWRLELFGSMIDSGGQVPALKQAARQLAEALGGLWSEVPPMPLYPAFRLPLYPAFRPGSAET